MYVKQIELTRFKSFGSTTSMPLLPGFTVISGPNGSGKSNILDAILFALGLSSSRGMRAEKLLDLVHSGSLHSHRRVETHVSVTFDLGQGSGHVGTHGAGNGAAPPREWKVSRRLRVSPGRGEDPDSPAYTSTFYINDVPCTLSELHEQLEAMHIYPNGYNVVLQGDVTSIISMNAKERRQIIDELAGVATFDRKIAQANNKLEAVREQIERFRLIEQELQAQGERLLKESEKAQQYQQLRLHLETLEQQQQVLLWQHLQTQVEQTQGSIQQLIQVQEKATAELVQWHEQLQQTEATLTDLQSRIHALGEEEYLQRQAQIATAEAQLQQTSQQIETWQQEIAQGQHLRQQWQEQLHRLDSELQQLQTEQAQLTQAHRCLQEQQQKAQTTLEQSREQLRALAQSSDAWVKQQRYLTRHIEEIRAEQEPLQQEHIRLQERQRQLERQSQDTQMEIAQIEDWLGSHLALTADLEQSCRQAETQVQTLAQELSQLQSSLELDRATHERLTAELHSKQRQLDKLETRRQVLQESQGSRATQAVLSARLPGVLGLVAQLGQVDPQYQLALEIAAGSRLQFVVVEDDTVAVSAVNFLKREKVGRATFLPLNKLQTTRPPAPLKLNGLVDYAIRLVRFEDRYRDVFGFVLGSTLVFESLELAQPHIGKHRIVTLEGELLETSGAITGGISQQRQGIHFSASEHSEVDELRARLDDLEDLLKALIPRLQAGQAREKHLTQALLLARQDTLQAQQYLERHQSDCQNQQARLQQLQGSLAQLHTENQHIQARLEQIQLYWVPLEQRLADLTLKLSQLEGSPVNQHWQQIQQTVQQQESHLAELQHQLTQLERQRQENATQQHLNRAKVQQHQERIQESEQRQAHLQEQIAQAQATLRQTQDHLAEQRQHLSEIDARLAHLRQERDQQEFQVRAQQQQIQRLDWERYNALTQQQEKEALLAQLQTQRQAAAQDLPDPLPELPASLTLEELQRQKRKTEDKLRSLEPVNMLAITEYEETQVRLTDLSAKLETLNQERTELLLRIENFSTLRRQAFLDAFHAVDSHFQTIFAQLSDGDGHLELENPEDPLSGGLTLVAHPKGKPVRRLSSMSGGEKSLTALSFIFALQRFRPSSFYAFDEVDMFLDGANVEKLANMIWQQSRQAQFLVVSLRRPMIEKAERTIGVTQARGAYTQVIGLTNPTPHVG
ncbi:chromosome segregation protein SMC [Synechococcus bigranulatus str. 'Rupite']|uniref:Chromosome partition protein Smc n=2 Tax=Thermostichus vulcanus TaxID=32053 RepID=A0ABT0CFC4_THEVL|nr:chromosome segregation protein SMC [Thermostichus vulcanus str. 'Rupite']